MITPKMKRVMRWVVAAATTPGRELTMDELVVLETKLAGKQASKQAMQSTVRILEGRGFLERAYEARLGRVRVYFLPTRRGLDLGVN